jgi:DNA-binding SARP family transcriptional activator
MYFDLALNPYDEDFIERMIEFYEKSEEYEKCKYLLDFKNKRFNHNYGYKNII